MGRTVSDRLRRWCRKGIGAIAASSMALTAVGGSQSAQAQGLPLIRDTEIENLLNDYAKPIFKAAGLGTGRVSMRIVKNEAFNAFVMDGRNVFIHTGSLTTADTPNQVIGVIAHEAGHIDGGHMAKLRARIAKDQTRVLLMQILGIGMMIGGAAAGGDARRELSQAGQGVLSGGTEVVTRSLLAEIRQNESAADQAGLRFLDLTRQSGRGMLETFERFAQQEYLSDAHRDAFMRTHPVASDRLARLRDLVKASPYYNEKDSPQLQLRHDLMRAKLAGYLDRPTAVLNRYPVKDNSLPARYARAIARFFQGGPGGLDSAIVEVDSLIKERPDYAYFHELKGDLLMRAGRVPESVGPLRTALKLAPDASLIRVQLASALQGSEAPAATAESVELLRRSLIEDSNPRAYRLLATAYYRQGKEPLANAETAQAYFLEGDVKQAQIFAKRAQQALTPGTPEWIKVDDIIKYKPQT